MAQAPKLSYIQPVSSELQDNLVGIRWSSDRILAQTLLSQLAVGRMLISTAKQFSVEDEFHMRCLKFARRALDFVESQLLKLETPPFGVDRIMAETERLRFGIDALSQKN